MLASTIQFSNNTPTPPPPALHGPVATGSTKKTTHKVVFSGPNNVSTPHTPTLDQHFHNTTPERVLFVLRRPTMHVPSILIDDSTHEPPHCAFDSEGC